MIVLWQYGVVGDADASSAGSFLQTEWICSATGDDVSRVVIGSAEVGMLCFVL